MRGMTLVEIAVVLVILATLAGLLIPLVGDAAHQAEVETTRATLQRLRLALVGGDGQPGYLQDMGSYPRPTAASVAAGREDHPQLRYLFEAPDPVQNAWDPTSRTGWRGPYLLPSGGRYAVSGGFSRRYGEEGDPTPLDAWGQAVILQEPDGPFSAAQKRHYTRLVSAGPDGLLECSATALQPALEDRGDDLVLFLMTSDAP